MNRVNFVNSQWYINLVAMVSSLHVLISKCKNTKPITVGTGVTCPKCKKEIVERKSRRGRYSMAVIDIHNVTLHYGINQPMISVKHVVLLWLKRHIKWYN